MPKLEKVVTGDGSITYKDHDLNEHYHSLDGAMAESFHVYIQNGLQLITPKEKALKVFELGLGMGYNAYLAIKEAQKNGYALDYFTLEPHPPNTIQLLHEIEDAEFLPNEDLILFQKIHEAPWGEEIHFDQNTRFTKYKLPLEEFAELSVKDSIDVIFYDAFAPSRQADIWHIGNLEKAFAILKEGGLLTTYCSQGQFKRNLEKVGFRVESEKGFGQKREMTVAFKG